LYSKPNKHFRGGKHKSQKTHILVHLSIAFILDTSLLGGTIGLTQCRTLPPTTSLGSCARNVFTTLLHHDMIRKKLQLWLRTMKNSSIVPKEKRKDVVEIEDDDCSELVECVYSVLSDSDEVKIDIATERRPGSLHS
jgi:hypothetical protein